MINLIQGNIGSGKTFHALDSICEELHTGHRKVYTNIPRFDGPKYLHNFNKATEAGFHPVERDDFISAIVVLPRERRELLNYLKCIPINQDSLIVIDESQLCFSRLQNNSSFVAWLSQYHSENQLVGNDSMVILITQNSLFLDSAITNLVEEIITTEKDTSCSCTKSDSWRCAVAQHLTNRISCPCECHRQN